MDPSIETLNNFKKNCSNDVFFALSHGVHRGILKKGKHDERVDFVNKLVEITPNIKFDLYGIDNIQPIWADSFFKSISNAKMGVNLSRGDPIKYYSSDRITQLIGNGLLGDNYPFYFKTKDDFQRKKIAKKGKQKYMKYFNSTLVADYIVKNTFNIPYKKSSFMWESK